MLREQLDIGVSPLASRDYDTIRNAIAHGKNAGSFTAFYEDNVKVYEWRMLGDIVEVKEDSAEDWSPLDLADLDHIFSGGVYGERMELHIGFLCYDWSSNEV